MAQSDLFLAPEIGHIEVPYFAEATAAADTKRRRGVAMNPYTNIEAQVLGDAAHAEALGNASGYAVQFSFAL